MEVRETSISCSACKEGTQQPFAFSMAFQPIINIDRSCTPMKLLSVISRTSPQARAITLAKQLGLDSTDASLSINLMLGAVTVQLPAFN